MMSDQHTHTQVSARFAVIVRVALLTLFAACGAMPESQNQIAAEPERIGTRYVVRDTTIVATFDAAGVAAPIQHATLSTMLMGPLPNGLVLEGDLTGVTLRTTRGDDRRWIRIGATLGDMVEVTAGLLKGDTVIVPPARLAATVGH